MKNSPILSMDGTNPLPLIKPKTKNMKPKMATAIDFRELRLRSVLERNDRILISTRTDVTRKNTELK